LARLRRAGHLDGPIDQRAAITYELAFHPDLTPALRTAGMAALVAGALTGGRLSGSGVAAWVLVAPLAPAVLRALTGREGPVLDLVWMAGLAGALLRATSARTWNLPPLWRLLLGAWALILTLAWPLVVARELAFDWRTLTDSGAINSWGMLTAGQVVAWVLYVVQAQLLGLLWFDWIAGELARDATGRGRAAFHALWVGASLASLVALYQGFVDLSFLSTPFWAGERRATGLLLDANGYGTLAALAAPVAATWLSARGRPRTAIAVFAINVVGLWMSGSRTALLSGVAGAVGLAAVFALRGRATSRAPRVAGVAAVILAVALLGLLGSAIGPLRRVAEVPLSRTGLSDLWSRGGYGTVALRMMQDTPWTGVGPGMYHVIAPDYWRVMAQMTLAFDNAQNWWRHQASELGALGAAPLFAWSALLAVGLVVASPQPGRGDAYLPRALLIGLGLASLLGMPTQSPVVLLWFFGLAAWWSRSSAGGLAEGRISARWAGPLAVTLLILVILHAAGTAVLARDWLSVPERAKRVHREYVLGAHAPEPFEAATVFRWTDDEARFVWASRTPWLLLRLWVSHPDAATAPVRVSVTTACQTLFEEELTSATPVNLGIALPEGVGGLVGVLDATVRVSRTWQPAPEGPGDTRRLGAGVISTFLGSRDEARAQNRFVELRPCENPADTSETR
jgi:hypothetical protein